MEIVDEKNKKIIKENKVGEIIFYGKNVCLGYAKNSNDLKKGDENKSKLFTGDLGYKDKDDFFYNVYFKPDTWRINSQNRLLKNIADDEFRAMFVCPKRNCIVSPYDGGMDIIVDTQEKRDKLKTKYKDWLSEREDGM